MIRVIPGDMREQLRVLRDDGVRVQSIVTDPPYHLTSGNIAVDWGALGPGHKRPNTGSTNGAGRGHKTGFMGKAWDGGDIAFRPETWRLCYELLPPGGHLLAFAGTRTYHRMACAIEEAGFELRDTIAWLYGSGFPKSHNVSKGIDRRRASNDVIRPWLKALGSREAVAAAAGVTPRQVDHWLGENTPCPQTLTEARFIRLCEYFDTIPPWADDLFEKVGERIGTATHARSGGDDFAKRPGSPATPRDEDITAPATDAARQWDGWGTALKPAAEYVCVAQKPYEHRQLMDMIGSTLKRLEHQLWSLLSANVALGHFKLSRSEFAEESASAPWSAAERSNTRDALCAQMDMSQFELATLSSLNTVRSWRDCWTVASLLGNTSTTETASSTTIDPKIWKSCLSGITPASIIPAHRSGAWSSANAGTAERLLNADALRLTAIHERSAIANASDLDAILSPDEGGLKPNLELICVARKPLVGTVAANVLAHGIGALNIDGCRIGTDARHNMSASSNDIYGQFKGDETEGREAIGRWPANVVHDGSDEVVKAFPETEPSTAGVRNNNNQGHEGWSGTFRTGPLFSGHADSGSAARFFYSSKADAADRLQSRHPTVKPVDLMRWLVRLVTPPGGTCLDPFAGSGTTGMACMAEGFDCILVEREAEYVADIHARIAHVHGDDTPLFRMAAD